jgi:hypothetical protein
MVDVLWVIVWIFEGVTKLQGERFSLRWTVDSIDTSVVAPSDLVAYGET